jgi:dolichyl-phosphate beta-glucosyltransferase
MSSPQSSPAPPPVLLHGEAPTEAATAVGVPFSLVVPLYNETRRLGANFPALAEFVATAPAGTELVFVDDGSDDGTADVVERLIETAPATDARVLRRPHRGKGAAIEAGLRTARAPHAAFCDVDLATPLTDVVRLVEEAERIDGVAIGSRDMDASRIVRHESAVRELLGKTYNRVVQATLVPGIVDTQCGAKAASTRSWLRILEHTGELGFAWDVEILAVALRLGVPVAELPVQWAHDPDSRVNVARDGARMLAALPRIRKRLRSTGRTRASQGGGVFAESQADELAASDSEHWWFRSKAEFVSAALPDRAGLLVDVGAGSGGVTAMLEWPQQRKLAVDGSDRLVEVARRRGLMAEVADVADVPLPAGSAEAVCLLDVIEHLGDPQPALEEARRLLAPDGRLVVTVPAHAFLWSAADEALGHARRYNRRLLRQHVTDAGFEVERLTHVFSWLVPPVLAKRRLSRREEPQLGLDVSSPAVDRAAALLTRAERALTRRVSLPAGTSLLCVARPRA